jgi:hypothetical protein
MKDKAHMIISIDVEVVLHNSTAMMKAMRKFVLEGAQLNHI